MTTGRKLGKPEVSIVIVTYNCEAVIETCIQSCLRQNLVEIIVIDNASTDASVQILEKYQSRIELVKNTVNTGFSQACNQGIKQATGEFIFLLNPDTSLTDQTTTVLSEYLKNDPQLGAVAPVLKYPDGRIQNYSRRFPSVCGLWVESFVPQRFWSKFSCFRKYTYSDLQFDRNTYIEQPAAAVLMIRSGYLLDEHYFIYFSDVHLCREIIKAGHRILQTPDSVVFHNQSEGGTGDPELRLYLDLDNYYGARYYFKHFRHYWKLLGYTFVFVSSLFLRCLLAIVEGRQAFSYRLKKLTGFIRKRNFRSYYEQ